MSLEAIIYKAWRINIRHYFLSILKIIVPLIPIIIIISTPSPNVPQHMEQSAIIFPKKFKEDILRERVSENITVAYYPKNPFTSLLMGNAQKIFPGNYVGFPEESDIEQWFINHTSQETKLFPKFGIIFQINKSSTVTPHHLSYTIRSIQQNVPDPSQLFPIIQMPGPLEAGGLYFTSEFLGIKAVIDDSFLTAIGMNVPNWSMQEFSYPSYVINDGRNPLIDYLPMMLNIFFLFTFSSLASFSLNEKKTGITERLRMVGFSDFMILCNYIVHSSMTHIISTGILSVLLIIKFDSVAILPKSNFLIIWIVLILYCLQSSTFFLAVSAIFNNPSLGIAFTSLLFFAPVGKIMVHQSSITLSGQIFSSLLPPIYLHWSFQDINGLEAVGMGASFSSIFRIPTSGHSAIPIIGLMILSLLGTVLYCLMYIYLMNVRPGPYGYSKPWHFIISKKFCKVDPLNVLRNESDTPEPTKGLYEKVPDNVEVGLQISNLNKKFGSVTCVKDLSLDIYVGQITALLGHNGAGKTTTLSMITGMHKPTSGSMHYGGYNAFLDLDMFRRDLGLCPQEDMLIGDISVWEHLIIFGMIKRLSSQERQSYADEVLKQVNLSHKKNVLVNELSGGMKRKLCLSLALIGNPKVVVLDEPTSGLDPESRREIWNILLKFRKDRVMIITTHFMEEADVLGDQIAIMDHGEIKCYGTPMFLKKHYGAGYQITVCCPEQPKFESLIQLVLARIPSAAVLNKTEEQIVFNIPSSNSGDFPDLFTELESNSNFPISRIGITCTTMDDVFLKVREEADKGSCPSPTPLNEGLFPDVPLRSAKSSSLFTNFLQRLISLICKNAMYIQDKWFSALLMIVIFPIIVSYMVIKSTGTDFETNTNSSVTFDLNIYGRTEVLLAGSETPSIRENFISLIKNGHNYYDVKTLNKDNIIDGLLEVARRDESKYRDSYIVAGSFNETVPNVLYSSIATHSPVIAINLLYNTFLKGDEKGNSYSISTTSHPFYFTTGMCSEEFSALKLLTFFFWLFWVILLITVIGNVFIKSPHAERTSLMKHLELMTGTSYFTYWLSFFLWDLFVYCFCMTLMFITFKSFDDNGFLSHDNASGTLVLMMLLFGISGLWMVYCFTFLFNTNTGANNLFFFINSATCLVGLLLINLVVPESKWYPLTYILRLIPVTPFAYGLELFIFKAMTKMRCNSCTNAYSLPECHSDDIHGSFFDSTLNNELYYLGFDWIVYFVILMLIEYGVFSSIWNKINILTVGLIENSNLVNIETDVAKERDRVDAALNTYDEVGSPIVIVDGLAKKFSRNNTAVFDVSFTSKEGECFGLLGVNGAGKSTTFNILSGVIPPTQGRALIKGHDLNKNKRLCLSYIGYCPQFSSLGEGLTGRQMLKLFANLRLAEPTRVEKLVDRWISLLGLQEYADRVCGTYSGGNKRKLSTAIAFINNPSVILLDEPTTGVDPVTRRNLWTVLKSCQNNKQTIIISSHSMDECEAVCDRLTIMASGYMQCIGNTQHLKSLYGEGFILLIKLKDHSENMRDSLKQTIMDKFHSNATLKDEHVMLLHYHINDPSMKISTLFSIMENINEGFPIIEEYSISDSSLEHIFLSFAKKKGEEA